MKSRPEEALLWQLTVTGLPKPEREFRFHPTRRWRFDFAYPDKMLAVEIEGGIWTNGAHTRGAHFSSDCEKYAEAALLGWTVLRVTSEMVNSGKALEFIQALLEKKGAA